MNLRLFTAICVLLIIGGRAPAQDEVRAIIEKAIKAHGGEEKIAKTKAMLVKNKGTIELSGSLAFTQEVTMLHPDKFKEVLHLEIQGKQITVTTVFNGTKAWLNVNGQRMELEGKLLVEIKEAAYLARLTRLVFLRDKTVELSALGEVKVNGRPALGVKVTTKGHRDLDLFFDKETSLLAKVSRRMVDPMTEQELTEERIITEYQEVEGQKAAKKVVVNRDGKKFLEAEVLEVKYPTTIDENEFGKP